VIFEDKCGVYQANADDLHYDDYGTSSPSIVRESYINVHLRVRERGSTSASSSVSQHTVSGSAVAGTW
jgi:hypothetical protein